MVRLEQSPDHQPVIRKESLHGNDYRATFSGKGFISSGYDDGTFIASISSAQMQRQWDAARAKSNGNQSEEPDYSFLDRQVLDMAGLFPEKWREEEIEFTITVKAQIIPAYIDPAVGE